MTDQEPFFIDQHNEQMDKTQREAWIEDQTAKAAEQGANWSRLSWLPPKGTPEIFLFEAWKVRPENEGKPRFHLSKQPYY